MSANFGQKFARERLTLSSGGVFDFDAVSEDRRVVAVISTGGATTASGKHAVGKILKIRSGMFFLLLTEADRRVVVLTELDMYRLCEKERSGERVPSSIEFVHALIPENLDTRLKAARAVASGEVSPKRN